MIDTRNKRMSVLGMTLAVRLVMPNPDGSFAAADDRAQLTGLYAGLSTSPPPPTPTQPFGVTHLRFGFRLGF